MEIYFKLDSENEASMHAGARTMSGCARNQAENKCRIKLPTAEEEGTFFRGGQADPNICARCLAGEPEPPVSTPVVIEP